VGKDFQSRLVARGAAYGDIDNDGDLDVLISTNGGAPHLFRNENGTNHYIKFTALGSKSNRDGIGTRISIQLENGTKLAKFVKSASSYCSQSQIPLTFGVGSQTKIKHVEIIWPSGKKDHLENVTADQLIQLKE